MTRVKKNESIRCTYFLWKVFQREGVWYADGRINDPPVGKHSLGTREYSVAVESLTELDAKVAVKHGLASPDSVVRIDDISIVDGWSRYLAYCGRSQGLGGVADK